MYRRIAAISAIAAVVTVIAFAQSSQGQDTLARIFGGASEAEALLNKNSGQSITLESIQREVEWRRATIEKLRQAN